MWKYTVMLLHTSDNSKDLFMGKENKIKGKKRWQNFLIGFILLGGNQIYIISNWKLPEECFHLQIKLGQKGQIGIKITENVKSISNLPIYMNDFINPQKKIISPTVLSEIVNRWRKDCWQVTRVHRHNCLRGDFYA